MEALVEKIKPNKNNGVSSIAMFDYIEGTHPFYYYSVN